jgi:hypothetical protein
MAPADQFKDFSVGTSKQSDRCGEGEKRRICRFAAVEADEGKLIELMRKIRDRIAQEICFIICLGNQNLKPNIEVRAFKPRMT